MGRTMRIVLTQLLIAAIWLAIGWGAGRLRPLDESLGPVLPASVRVAGAGGGRRRGVSPARCPRRGAGARPPLRRELPDVPAQRPALGPAPAPLGRHRHPGGFRPIGADTPTMKRRMLNLLTVASLLLCV